jgi:hypothetical protein
MKKKYTWILFVAFIGYNQSLHAQFDCAQTLTNAEQAYYTGRFGDVKEILANCMTSGFNNSQKEEAYRLLVLSNIFSRNLEQADSVAIQLLHLNPQYTAHPNDPPEMKKLLSTFNTNPVYGISLQAGVYYPMFHVQEVYNVRNIGGKVSYTGHPGFTFGLGLPYYFKRNWLMQLNYDLQQFGLTVSDVNVAVRTTFDERQLRSQLTLQVGYIYKTGRLSWQLLAGVGMNKINKATADIHFEETIPITGESVSKELTNFSNLDHRSVCDIRPTLMLSLGLPAVKNMTPYFYIRYELGTRNMSANKFSDSQQMTNLEWLEDDFKANYFSFGIGIAKFKYKVRKL